MRQALWDACGVRPIFGLQDPADAKKLVASAAKTIELNERQANPRESAG